MNCYKCGKEMRVVPEQVATDEKGLPVYHRIGYCDSCMSKFDIDIIEQNQKHTNQQNAPQKKKQSTLSILSVVFTLLGLTIPVAIILAIIDIVKGDKNNKNHSCSWFSIIFSAIVILAYFLGGQNEKNQNVSNNLSIESVIETESQTIELPDESVESYPTYQRENTNQEIDSKTDPTVVQSESNVMENENYGEYEEENVLSEEEYKESCVELFYDDIFFSKDDLEGKDVKLNLFVSELYELRAKDMYYDYIQEMFGEYNLQRNFLKCCVLREGTESYMGEQINVLFSNDYELNATDYSGGEKITVYGKIIGYSTNSWRGYNKCEFMPLYIE